MKATLLFLVLLYLCSAVNLSAQTYSGGIGTEDNPYLISSNADMEALALAVNGGNSYAFKYFLLTTDLKGIRTIIGNTSGRPFSGTFDGDGHVIDVNITTVGPRLLDPPLFFPPRYSYRLGLGVGLFGYIDNAVIQNLGITGSFEVSNSACGAIAGVAGNSIIINCFNAAKITNTRLALVSVLIRAGGICGEINGSIVANCYNDGNIYTVNVSSADDRSTPAVMMCAGIAGSGCNKSFIVNCFVANDTIYSANRNAAGVVDIHSSNSIYRNRIVVSALTTPTIDNCYAAREVWIGGTYLTNSQDPTSADGASQPFSSFQSQSWIDYNLIHISSHGRYNWDFKNIWKMSDINSKYKGLPILQTNKYPRTVSVGSQIGNINVGQAGMAFFVVSTQGIVNHQSSVILKGAPEGVTVSNSNILLSNNTGTLTIHTTEAIPPGIYPLTIIVDDTTESASFDLIIGTPNSMEKVTNEGFNIRNIPLGIEIETSTTVLVEIFSITGKNIYHSRVAGTEEIKLQKGVYILSINGENRKIVVN